MKKVLFVLAIFGLFFFTTLSSADGAENTTVYRCVKTDEKKIALTFDDGPHPLYTPEILEILKKNNVKATFFVVGENADLYPDILRQTAEEGHEIGDHTFSHLQANKTSSQKLSEDMKKSRECILKICEYNVRLFRPPGGAVNRRLTDITEKMDYKVVLWNIDTKDWTHKSADKICENVLTNVKGGSIILFHDYIYEKSSTAEALINLIPKLKEMGYTFVTVSDLIDSDL